MMSLQSVDSQKVGIEEGTVVDTWVPMVWGNRIDFIGRPRWTGRRRSGCIVEGDGLEGRMQEEIVGIEGHLMDDRKTWFSGHFQ